MARKSSSVASYQVGYGRPPVASRFRKGQSGNPSGRRKAAPVPAVPDTGGLFEEDEIILRVMREDVSDTGRKLPGRMTRLEAMWRAAFEQAAHGDARAAKMVREGVARAREAELALQRRKQDAVGPSDVVRRCVEALREAKRQGNDLRRKDAGDDLVRASSAGREEAETRIESDDEFAAACFGEVEADGQGGVETGPSSGEPSVAYPSTGGVVKRASPGALPSAPMPHFCDKPAPPKPPRGPVRLTRGSGPLIPFRGPLTSTGCL